MRMILSQKRITSYLSDALYSLPSLRRSVEVPLLNDNGRRKGMAHLRMYGTQKSGLSSCCDPRSENRDPRSPDRDPLSPSPDRDPPSPYRGPRFSTLGPRS